MPRIIVLAFATALLALPCAAAAQTTDSSGASADSTTSCAEPADAAADTPVAMAGAAPASDGTPAAGPDPVVTPASGGETGTSASSGGGAPPLADAAQEPEPEGPGQEQPSDPGGEPQTPTGEEPVDGEAPGTEGGGGLPRTGLAVLQLALLGLVLVLVGARIRVIAKRRRERVVEDDGPGLEADGLPSEPTVTAYRERAEEPEEAYEPESRDEWSFPDPDEEAPTGLLPSTAIARQQARLRDNESGRD